MLFVVCNCWIDLSLQDPQVCWFTIVCDWTWVPWLLPLQLIWSKSPCRSCQWSLSLQPPGESSPWGFLHMTLNLANCKRKWGIDDLNSHTPQHLWHVSSVVKPPVHHTLSGPTSPSYPSWAKCLCTTPPPFLTISAAWLRSHPGCWELCTSVLNDLWSRGSQNQPNCWTRSQSEHLWDDLLAFCAVSSQLWHWGACLEDVCQGNFLQSSLLQP